MSQLGVNLPAPILDHHPVPHVLTLYTVQAPSLPASLMQQDGAQELLLFVRFLLKLYLNFCPLLKEVLCVARCADVGFLNSQKHMFFCELM